VSTSTVPSSRCAPRCRATDMEGRHLAGDLVAYLRDELSPEDRARARRHLDSCRECAATLAGHREILATLAAAAPEPPALHWGAYRAQLRSKLQRRGERPRPWWRAPLPLSASAAVAALLVLLTLYATLLRPERRELRAFEETVLGQRLGILQESHIVENLELLEDLEIIRQLDRVASPAEGRA